MARKPDEWMPLHIGAYHADTTHLTRDQHGAYFLLLMAYWRRGGALPADDGRLAAIAKASPLEWRRLKPIIFEFFTEVDGHWHQKRADEELERAKRLTEAKANAGRKGAENKWHKNGKIDGNDDGTAMAQPSVSHRQSDAPLPLPSEEPSPIPSELKKATASPRRVSKPAVDLPDWLPKDRWEAFVEMRKKIRAPLTDEAMRLAILQLEKLRAQGENVEEILNYSIANSYRGVFSQKPRAGPVSSNIPDFQNPDKFKIIKVA